MSAWRWAAIVLFTVVVGMAAAAGTYTMSGDRRVDGFDQR